MHTLIDIGKGVYVNKWEYIYIYKYVRMNIRIYDMHDLRSLLSIPCSLSLSPLVHLGGLLQVRLRPGQLPAAPVVAADAVPGHRLVGVRLGQLVA